MPGPIVQPAQLISASAVALWAFTQKGQMELGAAQNFSINRVFRASHEDVIGSPLFFESVMHGARATVSFGRLMLIRQTLSQLGIIPTKNKILGWRPIDIRAVAIAGDVAGRTLYYVQGLMIEGVTDNFVNMTTVGHNINGTARYVLEANEI